MATIDTVLRLQDKMSSQLDKIEKAATSAEGSFKNVRVTVENMEQSMKNASTSSNGLFSSLMKFNIVSKIFNMAVGQLDNAITRFDTLNNFPKVMSNLGIGAEEAQASIDRMAKGLESLPTTLQDGALAVQRFTSSNKNIGKSTEMFLALNNAIIAGGGNAQVQASALEQLSQAYAKGKPDMMEWRTALMAMPAQMDQVAKVMGKTSATQLGEDLRSGTTSMDEFMNTIIQMNKEGQNGFKSLEEQARNATGGIQTALTNFRTAITKGVTDAIDNVNKALESSGLGTISDIIYNVGKALQNIISIAGQVLGRVIAILSPIVSFVINNWNVIKPILLGVLTAIGLYTGAVVALTIAEKAKNAAMLIGKGIMMASTFVHMAFGGTVTASAAATATATAAQWGLNSALLACPLTWILLLIIAIIAVIFAVVAAINKVTGKTISATGIIMGVLATAVAFIWNLFLGLLDFVLGLISYIANPWIAFANFFANLFNDPIGSIIHLFGDLADNVLGIVETIAQALDTVFGSNLAETVQGWRSGLSGMVEKVANEHGNGSYEKVMDNLDLSSESLGLQRWSYGDAYNSGYKFGEGLGVKASDALEDTKNIFDDVLGTDMTGADAINTTTGDSLLSDDDVQLLLDVATRDYKLNYQQITPEIVMNFGDIRETADVDDITNALADKLEEVYVSNLEVNA